MHTKDFSMKIHQKAIKPLLIRIPSRVGCKISHNGGQLQWLVTLGRFDLHTQVATMSRFRVASRQGHMNRLKSIYSYAIRTRDYVIRFRTDQPDYSFLPDQDFDWTNLYMVMSMKSVLMTCQNHLVRL